MYNCEEYSVDELSLVVMNDEFLYSRRHSLTKEMLNLYGVTFTHEQWIVLQDDLADEDE